MTLAIVQARTGSKRLPGKVLMRLGDKTVLEHVIDRVRAEKVGEVVVATSWLTEDDAIDYACGRLGVACYRGHPTDVLQRYVDAAAHYGCERVLRVTADCPFLDPGLLAEVAARIEHDRFDYVGVRGAPDGLHQEAITRYALELSAWAAKRAYDREHVVTFVLSRPDVFRVGWVDADIDGDVCTLDTPADLERLRRLAA